MASVCWCVGVCVHVCLVNTQTLSLNSYKPLLQHTYCHTYTHTHKHTHINTKPDQTNKELSVWTSRVCVCLFYDKSPKKASLSLDFKVSIIETLSCKSVSTFKQNGCHFSQMSLMCEYQMIFKGDWLCNALYRRCLYQISVFTQSHLDKPNRVRLGNTLYSSLLLWFQLNWLMHLSITSTSGHCNQLVVRHS